MRNKFLFALSLALAGGVGVAGAQASNDVGSSSPVTDYSKYPANSGVPEGCDHLGISGVSFDREFSSLAAGDVLTMSWENVSPECDGSPVTIAIKIAPALEFQASVDQFLHPNFATANLVAGSGGSLSFEMPDLNEGNFETCFYQLDAVMGLPLSVVGPSGSFYGAALRGSGPHLLIAAGHGSQECEAAPIEPVEPVQPPAEDLVPLALLSTAVVPSTAPQVPTGTTTTTQLVEASTAPPGATPSQAPQPLTQRSLAATGSRGESAFLTGLVALLLGGALIILAKNRKNRHGLAKRS